MRWFAGMVLAALTTAAQAELWAFVDNAGVAHFAAQRLDERYQPVMSLGARPQRVPGKTDHGRSLLTWLEFAPEVKAVQPYLREASQ
ncbi:MAG TPA: lytic transglycosylase domain-containing protein, partial [Burkholderiaceae bacterium]|nr:lytic transglycosylase domain-containing protein [Burkholderiaceae bacterium]